VNQFLLRKTGSRAVSLTLATALSVGVEVLRNRPPHDVGQVTARTRSAPRHLLEGKPNPIRAKRPTETRAEPSRPPFKNATTSPPASRAAEPPSRRAAPVDSAFRRLPSRTSIVVPGSGSTPHARSRTSSSPTTSSARENLRRRRVSDQNVAEGAASTLSAGSRRANRTAFSSSSKPPLANLTRTENGGRRNLAVPGSTLHEGDRGMPTPRRADSSISSCADRRFSGESCWLSDRFRLRVHRPSLGCALCGACGRWEYPMQRPRRGALHRSFAGRRGRLDWRRGVRERYTSGRGQSALERWLEEWR
jgi:hypothetical protein